MGLIIFVYPFFLFLPNNFEILILLKSHVTEITLCLHILLIPGHFKFKFRSIFNSYLIFLYAIRISSLFLPFLVSFFLWFPVGDYSNKKKLWHLYIFTKLQMEKRNAKMWGGGGGGGRGVSRNLNSSVRSSFLSFVFHSFFLSFIGVETYWPFIFPAINV